MKNKFYNKNGFTLIELLVAISIMGIIVLMALPAVRRVQLDNKDKKYIAYEKALKAATKLYVDGYDEDLFGNINSGCAKVTYNDIEEKKLIERIQVKDVTCKNDDTFIWVFKNKEKNHGYCVNIKCKDSSGNVVYEDSECPDRDSCGLEDPDVGIEGLKDSNAPILTILNDNKITPDKYIDSPYNNGKAGNDAYYPKMRLIIEDKNLTTGEQAIGLRPSHQILKYQWYKNGNKMSGTGTSGNLDVKVRDYYSPIGEADIPEPNADMKKEEPDARYAVRVFGTVEDMNGNKRTTVDTFASAWKPTDYPDSLHEGYEVEKQSKCPTLKWTQKNGSAASTAAWYNNDRNQISLTITPIDSVVPRFKANHYVVQRNIKAKDSDPSNMKDVDRNLLANAKKIYKIENTVNGKLTYNISYYKTAGTSGKHYTCSNSSTYKFDHIYPLITYNVTGSTGKATSELSAHKNHSGFKTTASISVKCDKNDTLSKVSLYYNNNKKSNNPFSTSEKGHGSYSKVGKCVDEAGNETAQTKNFFIIEYGSNDSAHCGCALCDDCSAAGCKTPSYTTEKNCYISYANVGCNNGGSTDLLSLCGILSSNTSSICCCKSKKVVSGCSEFYRSCDKCGCETGKSCWY